MDLSPGTVLADKYRVDRLLGQGGMGVVVAATHLTLRQPIAVKLLRPEAMANPSLVERFEREARAAARVHGEHVARVIDVGKLANGLPYIVMEYLEGEDLERALSRRGPLPIAEAMDYVLQACEAVAEAHAANIVHRDLKPANMFLAQTRADEAPVVKVLDFGISKILEAEADAITKTASLMGTAYYMSPEQLTSSKKVDTRTDIWALGVIMYELLSARRPFEAGTMPEVVALILQNEPEPIRSLRADVPAGLEAAITRCLQKATARFATVAELATAIAPFAPPACRASVARIHKLLTGVTIASVPPPADAATTRVEIDPQALSRGATVALVSAAPAAPVVATSQPKVQTEMSSAAPPAPAPTPSGNRTLRTVALAVGISAALGGGAFGMTKALHHDATPTGLVAGTASFESARSTSGTTSATSTSTSTATTTTTPTPSSISTSTSTSTPPPTPSSTAAARSSAVSVVRRVPSATAPGPTSTPSGNPLEIHLK